MVASLATALVALTGGCGTSPKPAPSAGSPLLAPAPGGRTTQPVDGIKCERNEQALFHVHAHLAVYLDGRPRLVPEGIGIAPPRRVEPSNEGPFVVSGSCFYWLHSHTRDGVIHIESPVKRGFTLGNYFDLWGEPLARDRVGPARGQVTAYLNGKRYGGDPRSIPLSSHAVTQLDVGKRVAPIPFTFPSGL